MVGKNLYRIGNRVFCVDEEKRLISYCRRTSTQSEKFISCSFDFLLFSMFVLGCKTGILKYKVPNQIDHDVIYLKINNEALPFSIGLFLKRNIDSIEISFSSLQSIWIDVLAGHIALHSLDNDTLAWFVSNYDYSQLTNDEEMDVYRSTLLRLVNGKIKREFARIDKEPNSTIFCTVTITPDEIDTLFFLNRTLFFGLYDKMFEGIKSYFGYTIYTNNISATDCITITAERSKKDS